MNKKYRLFLRFLKESHCFKNTINAYNLSVYHCDIHNFDDFCQEIKHIDNPYYTAFTMVHVARRLNLYDDYFYDVDDRRIDFLRLYKIINI